MASGAVTRRRNIEGGTKVKTGCATCRIRKIKCDETKPLCQKCVKTGRTCDGYDSPFRFFTSKPVQNAHTGSSKSDMCLQPTQLTVTEINSQDIDLLSRYFSTKTIFSVTLGLDEEARQILQASLTDPPVRHAVSSLKALREDLETSGDRPLSIAQQTSGYQYGLQRYGMALQGLVSNLSTPGSDGLRSALLCCQILISIEQVRKNYAAMAHHIIGGLSIMREYRARPSLVVTNKLLLAHPDQLPFLDVFIIKLFTAPCKFAEPPITADRSRLNPSVCVILPQQQLVGSSPVRIIAPDMRTELKSIAASTLEFLDKVSQIKSADNALPLLLEKAALLNSLESWLTEFELVQINTQVPGPEPISVSFLRFFHLILRIVLLGSLESSLDLHAELQIENDRLQRIANNVGVRVRDYKMCSGTSSGRGDRSMAS